LRGRRLRGRAATSRRDHFIPDVMKTDELRQRSLIEVTANGVSHAVVEFRHAGGLSEDRRAYSTCDEAAFWGLLYHEDDLAHRHDSIIIDP
jgi:hypothetical protein